MKELPQELIRLQKRLEEKYNGRVVIKSETDFSIWPNKVFFYIEDDGHLVKDSQRTGKFSFGMYVLSHYLKEEKK